MTSSLSLAETIAVSRNRWMVPLLADLAAHKGARFVELASRLDIPRDSLVRTLDAARAAGWVIPNPGHGHPLRPEYILTRSGERIAAAASGLAAAQAQLGLRPGDITRWGLPLVRAIDGGATRFSGLARLLEPATPRALSQGLRVLSLRELVGRTLIDGWPPTSRYSLTPSGVMLARAA